MKTDYADVVVRRNEHNHNLALQGQEWGGGPYRLVIGHIYMPVVVKALPAWATAWSDVYRVLRAIVGAFEFDDTASSYTECYDLVRAMWMAGVNLARRRREVTEWAVLNAVKPKPPSIPIRWVVTSQDARGKIRERQGHIARLLGLRLVIIDTPSHSPRYEVCRIRNDGGPAGLSHGEYCTSTGFAFRTLVELQRHLREQLALSRAP